MVIIEVMTMKIKLIDVMFFMINDKHQDVAFNCTFEYIIDATYFIGVLWQRKCVFPSQNYVMLTVKNSPHQQTAATLLYGVT
jgi:hypothetical protein